MATKNHEASIKSLERQIGQISKQISVARPSSSLPSDTIANPKEECKAIQLRSRRTLMSNNDTTKKQAESIKEPIEDEKQTKADEAKEQFVRPNKSTEKFKEKDNQPQSSREMTQGQQQSEKSITSPLPYPQRFKKEAKDQHFHKFLEIFNKLEINIPLAEALEQMPLWDEKETVSLTEECKALIQKGLPPKLEDPGSFLLPCTIGNLTITKAMCDLGASINLIPSSLVKKLHIEEVKPVQISLELVGKSMVYPRGVIENLLVKVDSFIYPADFVVLNSNEDDGDSVILGRPFLATARAIIDVEEGELTLKMHDQSVTLKVLPEAQFSKEKKDYMKSDKGESQLKEENEKESHSNIPKIKVVQTDEGTQEDIGVLATEKRGPQGKPTTRKERSTKGKMKRRNKTKMGWKNRKIPTEGLSKGDKVQLIYQQLGTNQQTEDYYTVSNILSLEHAEIEHQRTKKRITVRGDKLRLYKHQPP
ncbi:uncharacterized protein LOC130975272 [Arachis stenosperma]|uniref:uncharacterized protein LOC130975272 n=1 Tax=Arachis stenosperma TaxID=217475 RepID=UPI0025AC91DE|nr:uncharacterized protein LOC130975272 [Arachis stenosperma]